MRVKKITHIRDRLLGSWGRRAPLRCSPPKLRRHLVYRVTQQVRWVLNLALLDSRPR